MSSIKEDIITKRKQSLSLRHKYSLTNNEMEFANCLLKLIIINQSTLESRYSDGYNYCKVTTNIYYKEEEVELVAPDCVRERISGYIIEKIKHIETPIHVNIKEISYRIRPSSDSSILGNIDDITVVFDEGDEIVLTK